MSVVIFEKNYIKVFGPIWMLALSSTGVDGGRWQLHKNKNKNHPTPLYSPVDHSNLPPPKLLKKKMSEKNGDFRNRSSVEMDVLRPSSSRRTVVTSVL